MRGRGAGGGGDDGRAGVPKPLLALLAGLAVLVVLELGARVVLGVLARVPKFRFTPIEARLAEQTDKLRELLDSQGDSLVRLDPEIGWVYGPGHRGDLYSSNSQGLRGRREYAPRPPPGVLRLAAFGDSFVHANEVADADAWSARLESLDPRLEVLNFGVGGFGTDQALLLARRRLPDFDPQVVVLGFAEVNLARNVNRYRRFLSPDDLPLFKPRFLRAPGGVLERVANPFPGLEDQRALLAEPRGVLAAAPHDFYFEPLEWRNPLYDRLGLARLTSSLAARTWRSRGSADRLYRGGRMNDASEAFELLVALVRQFAGEVAAGGREFLLVVFPTRSEDVWGGGSRVYQPLLDAVADLRVLDLAEPLAAAGLEPSEWLRPGGHYGAAANRIVAEAVHGVLDDLRSGTR